MLSAVTRTHDVGGGNTKTDCPKISESFVPFYWWIVHQQPLFLVSTSLKTELFPLDLI